jgi:uncharacterized protein (UPF0335 family)
MSEPAAGHNGQLKSIVERIENIESQIKEFGKDRAEVYLEAKGSGWDVKALRTIIRLRKQSPDDRAAQEAMLETYMHALGMI